MRDSNSTWQKNLAQGFATADELLQFLDLPSCLAEKAAEHPFKTRVPRGFAERMQPGNPKDPLLLQVLATAEELEVDADYLTDPLKERAYNPLPGLIHKYHGRVLFTLTGACAIHCRYCFRRHFPYENNNPGRHGWRVLVDYIQQDRYIREVILSGGDPLLLKDDALAELLELLASISHLKRIRFHTRIPIVLPERITENFGDLLRHCPLSVIMVLHCNHPQELNHTVAEACVRLKRAGCHLLNQSVLLAGINNEVETLVSLSEELFAMGVLPYYLHLLDKVRGTAHFDVRLEEALALFSELQARLPGYLVPRLAREEAGERSKTLL